LLLFPSASPGQQPAATSQAAGTIQGRLTRANGSGVAGATIALTDTSTTQITSIDGGFVFSGLAPGTYSLTFLLGSNVERIDSVIVTEGRATIVQKSVDWEIGFGEALTVVAPSRQLERIVDAPAAVARVTDVEIEHQAPHGQLPKFVEFTPGVEVTQSGLYDYNLNTRGFNSSLNRRVATIVDGVDISIPFLASQEWSAAALPADDIWAVELVRGPSAALYGANASSGVLNITTKPPREYRGSVTRLTYGEVATVNIDLRSAWEIGRGWYGKVAGAIRTSRDFSVSRTNGVEYTHPCPRGGSGDCLPVEAVPLARTTDRIYLGSMRFDKHLTAGSIVTFEGGDAKVAGPVVQTGIGRVQLLDVSRPWARVNVHTDRRNVLVYYSGRRASKQRALGSGSNLALKSDRLRVEAQEGWSAKDARLRAVLGTSAGVERNDSVDPESGRQTLLFKPVGSNQGAAFGQIDWDVRHKLRVVFGSRVDANSLHPIQVSPKAALVYALTQHDTIRLTYSRAFQVPNYAEYFVQADAAPPVDLSALNGLCAPSGIDCAFGPTRVLAVGNENLKLERMTTIEAGYKGLLAGRAFVTVDYYHGRAFNLVTDLLPQLGTSIGRTNPTFGPWQGPPGLSPETAAFIRTLAPPILSNNLDGSPILVAASYTNFGSVNTQGIDVGFNGRLPRNWNATFNYSWFDFSTGRAPAGLEASLLPNSPTHKFAIGISYAGALLYTSLNVRWVDQFRWVVGPFQGTVNSYETADFVASRPLNDDWTVGLTISNLLNNKHWESFGGDILRRRALVNLEYKW
jgi:outer membrane receptor protein involved in Fe transport